MQTREQHGRKYFQQIGFTLIEMLLVLAIISMLVYLGAGYYQQQVLSSRLDKTSLQMQQILNAGLAYYIANGQWPTDLKKDLLNDQYLPSNLSAPWPTQTYGIYAYVQQNQNQNQNSAANLFSVYLKFPASAGSATMAQVVAGKLPLSFVTSDPLPPNNQSPTPSNCKSNKNCYVVGQVNIPGQNLNNAMAMNFAGLYHQGGCVPVPQCPAFSPNGQPMSPQIFLVPVSVSGLSTSSNSVVASINSFTAYATGGTNNAPESCANADPNSGGGGNTSCGTTIGGNSNTLYWRACLQVVTPAGDIEKLRGPNGQYPGNKWGQTATMAAFTRCAISGEAAGSSYSFYTN